MALFIKKIKIILIYAQQINVMGKRLTKLTKFAKTIEQHKTNNSKTDSKRTKDFTY